MRIAAAMIILLAAQAAVQAQTTQPADTKVVIVEPNAPVDKHHQRLVDAASKGLPAGYKLRLEYVLSLDMNVGTQIQVIRSCCPVNAAGKLDGEMKFYELRTGEVSRLVTYKDDVQNGPEKQYKADENSRFLVSETPWVNGKIEGVKKTFYPNGNVMSETGYKASKRDGQAKRFDLAGRVEQAVAYKDDKKNGVQIDYYSMRGKPQRVIPYLNGRAEGVVREYYDSGQLKREAAYKNDLPHGVEKNFDEQGTLTKTRYLLKNTEVTKEQYEESLRNTGAK